MLYINIRLSLILVNQELKYKMDYKNVTPKMLINNTVTLDQIDLVYPVEAKMRFARGKRQGLPIWYRFILYYLTGSSNAAARYLKANGIVSSTGKPYAAMTILNGAWEWILKNTDEARAFFDADYEINGSKLTDSEYATILITHAASYKGIFKNSEFFDWMIAHDYIEEHQIDLIKEKRPEVYRQLKTRSLLPV